MIEYFENREQMIEKVKKERHVRFVKEDKNGTMVFVDCSCSRCGGDGIIPYYGHVDNGVCFGCGGSGVGGSEEIKIYTPEYGAKLKAQREAREEKKRQELIAKSGEYNKEWMEREGFNEAGITFVVLGNTYEIKDDLKAHGAKFNGFLGWHMPNAEGYDAVPVQLEKITQHLWNGRLDYISNYAEIRELVSKLKDEAEQLLKVKNGEPISEYVGKVGERLEFEADLVGEFTFETPGYMSWETELMHIYKFKTAEGNIVVWKTTSYISEYFEDNVKHFKFKGTVKEHSEYKGEKQTVVNRVKIL